MNKIFEEKYGIDLLNIIKPKYTIINGNNDNIIYEKEYTFKGIPKDLIIVGDNYKNLEEDFYKYFDESFKIYCNLIISDIFYELNLMKIFEDGNEFNNKKMLIKWGEDHMYYINIDDIKENYIINLEIPDEEYFFRVVEDNGKLKVEHSNFCVKLCLNEK